MIQAKFCNLSKSYGEVHAVKNLDLNIYKDEILAIVGPSGCGKTTLLQLISGLEKPDSGSIIIKNEVVFDEKSGVFKTPEKRNIALVFQNYAVWPHKTVFQNVSYPLKIKKIDPPTLNKKVEEILSLVKLSGKEGRYPHELSGGEKQRVALARALVMSPKLLLLDEPFSNLDANLREEMQFEIKRIREELGLTIIHVTHDQNEAMGLANRIAVMNKGEIIQIDSPKEIYENPNTDFVANFIGISNDITELLSLKKEQSNTDEWRYIVRPEDVILNKSSAPYKGKILSSTYRGNLTQYKVESGALILKIEVSSDINFKDGEYIEFDFKKVIKVKRNSELLN